MSAYSLIEYGAMVLDEGRTRPYVEALRQSVSPGCVVADLGAGPGIFSLLACQFGAARVYAIEPDESILVARECAAANGYADRMTCIQAMSTEVELPERVDVIVSDLRGALPMYGHHFKSIADARTRFLKPGGRIIPARDTIRCAPVDAEDAYKKLEEPWKRNHFGLDLSAGNRYTMKSWNHNRFESDHMLAPPADWVSIDYATVTDSDLDGEVEWTIARDGTLHGLCIWFDADLCDGIGYRNSPDLTELVYGRCFIPLAQPVAVIAGDRIHARLRANMVHDDYVYRWDTRVSDASGNVKAEHRQSTLGSGPRSPDTLRKRADTHVPKLREQGQVDRFVLESMARALSLREISEGLVERFPKRFSDWRRALDVVAELSVKYSD